MMIGGSSGIPFAVFFVTLAPVALFGFIVAISLLPRFHRDEFSNPRQAHRIECPIPFDRLLLIKSSLASAILFGSFFAGAPIAVAALIAGATLLVTRRVYPEEVYAQIDGSLLVMFSGPFIVLAGVENVARRRAVRLCHPESLGTKSRS